MATEKIVLKDEEKVHTADQPMTGIEATNVYDSQIEFLGNAFINGNNVKRRPYKFNS